MAKILLEVLNEQSILPVQEVPLPLYPVLQEQKKDPSVL